MNFKHKKVFSPTYLDSDNFKVKQEETNPKEEDWPLTKEEFKVKSINVGKFVLYGANETLIRKAKWNDNQHKISSVDIDRIISASRDFLDQKGYLPLQRGTPKEEIKNESRD